MVDTLGRHVLMEFRGCDSAVLNDQLRIEALLMLAVEKAGATPIKSLLHPFIPQGVSGVIVLQESHISIHTWPEEGYAALDFYTCGECTPEAGVEMLRKGFGASHGECMVMQRGLEGPRGIRLAHHYQISATDSHVELGDLP